MTVDDLKWMEIAFLLAEEALLAEEVPIGCVFVKEGSIIAKGRNRVNETKNATHHAEKVAINQMRTLISSSCAVCTSPTSRNDCQTMYFTETENKIYCEQYDNVSSNSMGIVKKKELITGKCDCDKRMLDKLSGTTIYVTCEPCIMCAAALRVCNIGRVVFGCSNDRFGGNGSVLSVHNKHSSVLPGYKIVSGMHADRARELLVNFYQLENKNAPEHKRKLKI